ncbi:MAG: hypothetical protein HP491_04190 [Nitrospira sp.]|nr:hypothetical protein [Nitrospira sp.]MBH0182157.1 hypothetical protein [Nitrospira sp.]MBH0184318.1 hypothetical protein [Nitrospira sp.]
MTTRFCIVSVLCSILLVIFASARLCEAAEKIVATIHVKDALTVPGQSAAIDAQLEANGASKNVGMGGEPLELVVDGKVAATATTGADGRAAFSYSTKTVGVLPIQVRLGASTGILPAVGEANLVVWERRNPILAIETASLVDEARVQDPISGIDLQKNPEHKPMPDAAVEIGRLTQFYYKVIYIVPPVGSGGFQASTQARAWLKTNQFPSGYILVLPSGNEALGTKIDELRAFGWNTIKAGIGRTKVFAEVFLQRRMDAVMIPEPPKSEIPRKAKTAKEWKEIRKKL